MTSSMPPDAFEYDVFLSFASSDQELIRPLWQELSVAGLRVFWSDANLREGLGTSWFEIIQDSLVRSRHLLVLFTPAALGSSWVRREYAAFFNHCYQPPERLLIPVLAASEPSDLPLFLRELEAWRLSDGSVSRRLVRLLGGVDVEGLRREIIRLNGEIDQLHAERAALDARLAEREQELITERDRRDEALAARDALAGRERELIIERDRRDKALSERNARLAERERELIIERGRRDEALGERDMARQAAMMSQGAMARLIKERNVPVPAPAPPNTLGKLIERYPRTVRGIQWWIVSILLNLFLFCVAAARHDSALLTRDILLYAVAWYSLVPGSLWFLAGNRVDSGSRSLVFTVVITILVLLVPIMNARPTTTWWFILADGFVALSGAGIYYYVSSSQTRARRA